MKPAFYDPTLSYEENFEKGPPINFQKVSPPHRKITQKQKFLGFNLNLPFGIPAGTLLNSKFIESAFAFGFDLLTYKTVRSDAFPCHPFPNILYVDAPEELYPDKNPKLVGKQATEEQLDHVSITNSFGVPSKTPQFWQEDMKKAIAATGNGQLLICSFMGTVRPGQTQEEFIADYGLAAKMAYETGAKALETNLSCPNIGNEGLVCYNLDVTEKVCKAIRENIGNTPLILKVGYYKDEKDIERLAHIANQYAQCVAAINTLQIEVVDENGNQALPGKNRLRSGICGASIKWAGLEMVKKLNQIRRANNYPYEILGIGGVMKPEDYFEYRNAGADCVQSSTGTMWNPSLAHEIWKQEQTLMK